MEKKFGISKKIIELSENYETSAQQLVSKLNPKKPVFIEIDCMPNGQLNVFNYQDGRDSLKSIIAIGESFIGVDRVLMEQRIANTEIFTPNYGAGEYLGLWKRVKEDNLPLVDWSKPFCLKNDHGLSKIWFPGLRRHHKTGSATRNSLIRFIKEERVYLQPIFKPLPAISFPSWGMFYRLIFFCSKDFEPEFMGGLWISRSGLKIYPDEKSVIGLISPQTI